MGFEHTHRLRVRYAECDMQGRVFNANWLTYFDEAITELWRAALGPYEATVAQHGVDMVVAETTLSFRGPARFDEELDITATIERFGETSLFVALAARRGESLLAEARTRYVFVDAQSYAKTPAPQAIRAALT